MCLAVPCRATRGGGGASKGLCHGGRSALGHCGSNCQCHYQFFHYYPYPISSHSCGIPHPRSKCIALKHAFIPCELFMGLCKGIWDLEQSHLWISILTWEFIQGFGTITSFNFDDPRMVIWWIPHLICACVPLQGGTAPGVILVVLPSAPPFLPSFPPLGFR